MDIVAFLQFAEAIRVIYEERFEPADGAFAECSSEQYAALEKQGYDRSRRWFVVTGGFFEPTRDTSAEPILVDEGERQLLLDAARWIHRVTDTSGAPFSSFAERLKFLTDRLPEVIWKSAAPKARPHLRLVP